MPYDFASLIMQGLAPRSQALLQASKYKAEGMARREQSIADFGAGIAKIPALIEQRKAQDEERDVNDAFVGSYSMDGNPDNAIKAVQLLQPRTPAGVRAKLALVLQHDTLRKQYLANQMEQQKADLEKQQRAAVAAAYQPVPVNVGAVPLPAPTGGMPPSIVPAVGMRPPNAGEIESKLGRSGVFNLPDIRPMALAALTDDRVRALADQNNEQKDRRDEARNAIDLLKLKQDLEKAKMRSGDARYAVDQRTAASTLATLTRARTAERGQDLTRLSARERTEATKALGEDRNALYAQSLDFNQQMAVVREQIAVGRLDAENARAVLANAEKALSSAKIARKEAEKIGLDTDSQEYKDIKAELDDMQGAYERAKTEVEKATPSPRMPTPGIVLENGGRGKAPAPAAPDAFRESLSPEGQSEYDALDENGKAKYRKLYGGR